MLVKFALVAMLNFCPHLSTSSGLEEDSVILPQVDLSQDETLQKILYSVIQEEQSLDNDKVYYYTCRLSTDSCGYKVKIIAQTKVTLSNSNGYSGYACIDSIPIIFINKSDYALNYISNEQECFPMDLPNSPPFFYDPHTWIFIIKFNQRGRKKYGTDFIRVD